MTLGHVRQGHLLMLAVIVFGCMYATLTFAGVDKVTLCHKGKHEITVGAPAVQAHLDHGDTVGSCDDGGGGDPDPV